jgi:hypothetical protein
MYQHTHKLYRLFQTFKEKIPPIIDEILAISANTNIYLVIHHAPLLSELKDRSRMTTDSSDDSQ